MTEYKQSIVNIAEICARKDVHNFFISPGSRSAPLTLAFLRHPKLICRTVVDERSAAFIALGLAQQIQKTVGLVCTSGTAALNYAPAVVEAFYQEIPLIIFTSDRPPEWIDQNDGQTMHQQNLYGKHCRASFELPVDASHPDAKWHIERILSEAINRTLWPVAGPVHINVPLREPLYPQSQFRYQKDVQLVSLSAPEHDLPKQTWTELLKIWIESHKTLIVAGLHKPNAKVSKSLSTLHKKHPVLCDVTSNLHHVQSLHHYDMILGTENSETRKKLAPNLLITFGGPVVSKNLKLFLRKFKPEAHWQIQPSGSIADTFQSVSRILPVTTEYFFATLSELLTKEQLQPTAEALEYKRSWINKETTAQNALEIFLREAPHCELKAMALVLKSLPQDSLLQLGNSAIVRLANLVGLAETSSIQINSNRGVCGIDGTLSTAVGAALATEKITALVLGDLAFFYDRNGLWHNHVPANLRIIIFNNYGGGIFRVLEGSRDLPELTQHFEAEHQLSAENTAKDHGLNYFTCDSIASLEQILPDFFDIKNQAAVLEVKFDKLVNAEAFLKFKSMMEEI